MEAIDNEFLFCGEDQLYPAADNSSYLLTSPQPAEGLWGLGECLGATSEDDAPLLGWDDSEVEPVIEALTGIVIQIGNYLVGGADCPLLHGPPDVRY